MGNGMKININEIIDYYAKANISFAGLFVEYSSSSGRRIDRRTNPFYGGLVIPMSGDVYITLDGTTYMVHPGVVLHAGPGMRINIEGRGDRMWRIAVIHYYLPENERGKFYLFRNHFSFLTGESAKIPDLIQQLLLSQSAPEPSGLFRTKLLFMTLLGELFDSAKRQLACSDTVLVGQVMEYIRQNHAQPITISQTAELFGLDRRRLAALFEHYVGMTPSTYLIECRILKAKELLRTCSCPVKQVAECVGYSDSLYFSKAFKKQIGVSPSKFQERERRSV